MKLKDKPAFARSGGGIKNNQDGMTLREHCAVEILKGIVSNHSLLLKIDDNALELGLAPGQEAASVALYYTDSLIAELEKTESNL